MTDSTDRAPLLNRRMTDHCLAARAAVFAIPLALAQVPSARAGHPLSTDDVGTQGTGAAEVELSGLAEQVADLAGDIALGLGVALHTGLSERVDLGVTAAWGAAPDLNGRWESAMDDPALDLKWRVLDRAGALPGLAVRFDYEPPQSAVDANGHDAGAALLVTWEREQYAASVNLAVGGRELETSDAHWCALASAGGLVALVGRVFAGGEVVAEIDDAGVATVHSIGALVWEAAASRSLSLGAGASRVASGDTGWIATLALTSGFGGD